jgi:hypothetical protein
MMQKILFIVLSFTSTVAFAVSSHQVKGHTKKDGTYVQPHRQTNPDQRRSNNYSSEGNYNPTTGKQGKQRNENSNPPQYNDSYNDGQGKLLNQLYGNPPKRKKSFQ